MSIVFWKMVKLNRSDLGRIFCFFFLLKDKDWWQASDLEGLGDSFIHEQQMKGVLDYCCLLGLLQGHFCKFLLSACAWIWTKLWMSESGSFGSSEKRLFLTRLRSDSVQVVSSCLILGFCLDMQFWQICWHNRFFWASTMSVFNFRWWWWWWWWSQKVCRFIHSSRDHFLLQAHPVPAHTGDLGEWISI